ncbi:hypothetical protein P4O66_017466 [Electrophorus voltai]|uniref:Uncharacterized protein n=1 Tax=Electrophorus voltai TaxID=2609070 RepID=A0AAD8YUC7_9TELE|nr:hypothetical protein P4O66_017466 [Electrophorus voltai]
MWPEVRNGTVLELGEGNESQVKAETFQPPGLFLGRVAPVLVWTGLISLTALLSVTCDFRCHSVSQVVVPAPVWLPLTSLRNGSMVASPSPLTETPLHKRSGIIPGWEFALGSVHGRGEEKRRVVKRVGVEGSRGESREWSSRVWHWFNSCCFVHNLPTGSVHSSVEVHGLPSNKKGEKDAGPEERKESSLTCRLLE